NGFWKKVKSGLILKWDQSDNSKSELRIIHFDDKVRSSKFRLTINNANLKKNEFRIDEIEFMGNIFGVTSKSKIKEIKPNYALIPIGSDTFLEPQSDVNFEDGSQMKYTLKWEKPNLLKENITSLIGTMPVYSEKGEFVIDVFDPNKTNDLLEGHWAENTISQFVEQGVLGSISLNPEKAVTMGDVALIFQRINNYHLENYDADINGITKNDGKYLIFANAIQNKTFDEDFYPNSELTRISALKCIMSKIDITEKGIIRQTTPSYTDISDLSDSDKATVNVAYGIGIISDSEKFRFNDNVTLSEFVTMLSKALNKTMETDSNFVVTNFSDNKKALVNPNMGLFSYYLDNGVTGYDVHYDNDDYFEDIEGLSNIYIRVPWSVVEPEKDVYDFSIIDGIIQKFSKKGKQVSLRFTASETGYVYATPKWVFDDGAKIHWWDDGRLAMPYYNDEVFLKHLDDFLGEVAKRYDGNPNIAYIDIGSIGLWGEGHTGNSLYNLTPEEVLKHMELHRKHFKKTSIIVLDDLGFGFNDRFTEEIKGDIINMKFGLRNDGYAGIDGNMRFIREEDVALADGIWQQAPIVMEPEHYSEMKRVDNWGDGMGLVDWIDKVHGTYLGLHGYVREFYNENPEFAQAANMRIGYRILPEKVQIQSEVTVHDKIKMKVDWKNVAAAPCYNGGYPTLTLKDQNDNIVSTMVDDKFNVKDLPVAGIGKAEPIKNEASFRIHDVLPGGKYKAYLSVGTLDGTPAIAMPIEGNDGQNRYFVGDVNIKGDYGIKATKIDESGNINLRFDFHGNPKYKYKNFWMSVAMRECDVLSTYMPGDMAQGLAVTQDFQTALENQKTFEYPIKLEIQDQYKGKKLEDKSVLIGKKFDVYFVMDTLSLGDAPGMYLSDKGRDVQIGTAVIDENLNVIFTPIEE
ncbi:MAG: DUF4832 domain-containing protein, partial [Oscillospiraceae bacterium]